jgi:hypothetical protein
LVQRGARTSRKPRAGRVFSWLETREECGQAGSALQGRCEKREKPASSEEFLERKTCARQRDEDGTALPTMEIRTVLRRTALILLAPVCLQTQVQLTDTPAAHQLSAWLVAFDSGGRATLLAFLQKTFPLAPLKLTAKWVLANKPAASNLRKLAIAASRNVRQFCKNAIPTSLPES